MTLAALDLWLARYPDDEPPVWPSIRSGDGGKMSHAAPALSPDDEALVIRVRGGDQQAFRELWDTYHHRLTVFADRYLRSSDAAADVVQQLFANLWLERATFAPTRSIASHLYGAVRFRVLRDLRHARVEHRYADRMQLAGPEVTENTGPSTVISAELLAQVQHLLDQMTPRVREIFLLSRVDRLSAAQIAEVLGIAPAVVYNQLSKALKVLAEGLRPLLGE